MAETTLNGVRRRSSPTSNSGRLLMTNSEAPLTSDSISPTTGNLTIKIATLNCWALPQPWPIGSKHRKYRLDALAEALNESDYDIVSLQELWSERDFLDIYNQVRDKFPYRHYFHSGYTGSGTCIMSRWRIMSTLIHRYSLNGFPHHIHRGDWFGGKVVGLAEIIAEGHRLCVYTTHLHAEYNRNNDLYLPHRLSQAFELAQFVRHTSRDADFLILTGDFNIEPEDLGYHIIRTIANLKDAWLDRKPISNPQNPTGMTCDRPDNCFTNKKILKSNPFGKRLDYIMYQSIRKNFKLLQCENCFDVIPGPKKINFSDHLGVSAIFELQNFDGYMESERHINRQFLEQAQDILNEGEKRIIWDRRFFGGICFLLLLLIFGISNLTNIFPFSNIIIIIIQIFLTLLLGFSFWHGLVFLTIERRAITETSWNIIDMLGGTTTT